MDVVTPPVAPGFYDRGLAAGYSDVKRDELVFRFKEEVFKFPTSKAIHVARYNGYFYEARVDDLRRLEAEAASG